VLSHVRVYNEYSISSFLLLQHHGLPIARLTGLCSFDAQKCFVNVIHTYTYPYIRFTNPTSVNSQLIMKQLKIKTSRTGMLLVITQRVVKIYCRRFGTSRSNSRWDTIGPETSVRNYHYWLLNNPDELSSHLPRGGRLKSRKTYKRTDYVTAICQTA